MQWLVEEYNFRDKGLFAALSEGFPLLGDMPFAGLFEPLQCDEAEFTDAKLWHHRGNINAGIMETLTPAEESGVISDSSGTRQ